MSRTSAAVGPGGLTDLTVERDCLAAGCASVIGIDEVGRGCTAGPVAVGAVWCDVRGLTADAIPAGLRDSKQIPETRRPAVAQAVHAWLEHVAVGFASAAEIDALGMTGALALAGRRALADLPPADRVLLDGRHNWLGWEPGLLHAEYSADFAAWVPPVEMFVKGDGRVVTIAAASVVAKVTRDDLMVELDDQCPGYGWADNKGYPSPAHKQAVRELGPSQWHRRSFAL